MSAWVSMGWTRKLLVRISSLRTRWRMSFSIRSKKLSCFMIGLFLARISKGRTVRQFVIAVLLVPTVVTLIWMTAFGGTGLNQAINGVGELANGISDVSLAMFHMLQNLPLASITSFLGIVLVLVFFVTSSDSGSLVIDSITAGGKMDAPKPQRVFWATLEGVIAGTLLFGGGAIGVLIQVNRGALEKNGERIKKTHSPLSWRHEQTRALRVPPWLIAWPAVPRVGPCTG